MDVVEDSVGRVTLIITLAIVVTAVLVIVAAVLIGRTTTRPLRELTKASKRIVSGELGQKLPVRSRDEIGLLSEAFNEMSSNLDKLIGDRSAEKTKIQTVLANMADRVIMTDAEGKIILADQATERLFDFQEIDAIDRPLIETVHDHEADEILRLCLGTSQTQAGQFESASSKRFLLSPDYRLVRSQ